MDEIQVFALIAEGENARIEFKRELDLTVARSKAEFIKDVIALANTAQDVGYLLVGVDDNKMIVGTRPLEEEQIQQILSTYITPPVIATCEIVPIPSVGFSSIAILEIRPSKKPHSVARTIEQLQQNRVFVRHSNVVAEASPDEIALMYERSQAFAENRQYIRAAEKHSILGNYEMAISAYSEALKLTPTAELFFARGTLYERHSEQQNDWQVRENIAYLAFKDYSDAVKLAMTGEMEKAARIRRWHVWPPDSNSADMDSESEYKWLEANTSGRELGEVLFVSVKGSRDAVTFYFMPDATQRLNEIISLGYDEPDVYFLRSDAHLNDSNYGLALEDIDKAIGLTNNPKKLAQYYMLRAHALVQMKRSHSPQKSFEDAFDSIMTARRFDPQVTGYYSFSHNFEYEMLYRFALDGIEHPTERSVGASRLKLMQKIVQYLAYWFGHLYTTHPKIAQFVREIVGEDYWRQNESRLR